MKTQSTSVMDVPNIEMYHEDMNVDSGDYRLGKLLQQIKTYGYGQE